MCILWVLWKGETSLMPKKYHRSLNWTAVYSEALLVKLTLLWDRCCFIHRLDYCSATAALQLCDSSQAPPVSRMEHVGTSVVSPCVQTSWVFLLIRGLYPHIKIFKKIQIQQQFKYSPLNQIWLWITHYSGCFYGNVG